ncbi:MAG: hypothetical protein ACLRMX_00210 [Lachnospira eligens]
MFKCGGNMTVQFDYHVNNPVENAIIGVKSIELMACMYMVQIHE